MADPVAWGLGAAGLAQGASDGDPKKVGLSVLAFVVVFGFVSMLNGGCIAGWTVFETPDGSKPLRDLQEGDLVPGIDFHGNQVKDCRITMKLDHGRALVFGNYTANHYMLRQDTVKDGSIFSIETNGRRVGAVPRLSSVSSIATDKCVAIQDAQGRKATAFTKNVCAGSLHSFPNLVAATKGLNLVRQVLGKEAFDSTFANTMGDDVHQRWCHDLVECAENITSCQPLMEDVATATKAGDKWVRNLSEMVPIVAASAPVRDSGNVTLLADPTSEVTCDGAAGLECWPSALAVVSGILMFAGCTLVGVFCRQSVRCILRRRAKFGKDPEPRLSNC
jgi:hypothetical protein